MPHWTAIIPVFHLGSASFASQRHMARIGVFRRAIDHGGTQHRTNVAQGVRRTDFRVDGFGFETFQHASISTYRFHQKWLDIFAVVGDGVVESQRVDGRHACFVANRHPRQRRFRPFHIFVVGVAHIRFRRIRVVQIHRLANAHFVERVHKFARFVVVVVVDDARHANVRRFCNHFGHGQHAVFVRVGHFATVEIPHAFACVHFVVGFHHAIFQRNHHRHDFECGARFGARSECHIVGFAVATVAATHHVHAGFYLACMHIHQRHAALLRRIAFEIFHENTLGNVLHFDVDGGGDVESVFGVDYRHIGGVTAQMLVLRHARRSTQLLVESQLQAAATAFFGLSVDVANGARCQRPKRFDAAHMFFGNQPAAHLSHAEQRKLLHLHHIAIRNRFRIEHQPPRFCIVLFVCRQNHFFVVRRRTVAKLVRQPPRQRVDIFVEAFAALLAQIFGACVHINAVIRHCAGHQFAVARIDVATHGRHLFFGFQLVEFHQFGLPNGLNQKHAHQHRHKRSHHQNENERETPHVQFVLI